jgi:hypothetical protein
MARVDAPQPSIFQAVRNLDDMETMSIPQKYRQIMTFYKYYSGEKAAPIPTIFSEWLTTAVGGGGRWEGGGRGQLHANHTCC